MKISVIIPVYNSSLTIIESLNSVVSELTSNTYDWEIIVIDDGSDDKSVDLIREYITDNEFSSNIQLIQQKNGGAAVARNTGLKIASGDYIAFNDSDDKWIKGKISLQMNYLISNPDMDMVGGIFNDDSLSTIPTKKIEYSTPVSIKDQMFKNYFSPQTTIFRKSILEKTGLFNEKMRYAEEGYFFNKIVYHGNCVVLHEKVTEPINKKDRWGESGLSGNLYKMERGELFNITTAYKSGYISQKMFLAAYCFSLIKYLRRVVLKYWRKLVK